MMMSASISKRKNLARKFSFTGINIKRGNYTRQQVLYIYNPNSGAACMYLVMNISLLKMKQGRDTIMFMISSPSDIDFLIQRRKRKTKSGKDNVSKRGKQCRDAVMMMSGPSGVRLAGGGAFLWFAALCQNSHASNFCIF